MISVFIGASLVLTVASGIGVFAGSMVTHYVSKKYLQYIAGIGFISIDVWMLLKL